MSSPATLSVDTYIDLLHLPDSDRLRELEKIGKEFLQNHVVLVTNETNQSKQD